MPLDFEAFKNTSLAFGAILAGLGYSYGQFRGGNRRANTETIAQHNLEREDWKGQRAALDEKINKLQATNEKLVVDLNAANTEIASLKSFVTLTTAPPAIVQLSNDATKLILDKIANFESASLEQGVKIEGWLEQIAGYLEESSKK